MDFPTKAGQITMFRHVSMLQALLAGSLAVCMPLRAETTRAELLQVYRQAVEQDARLDAARHGYRAQLEQVPQARAGLLPSLTAGASFETTRLQHENSAFSRNRSGMAYQASLNQPLLRLDRWYSLKAAQAGAAQAGLELASSEQSLVLQSAEVYFATLRALDTQAAAQAELKALERQLRQAQARLANGAASLPDVLDAQAAHDTAIANHQVAQREVADAFEALNRLTRQGYSRIAGIARPFAVQPPVPNNASNWVDQAMQSNLSLQASGLAVAAAEQVRRQRLAGHAPTLDATASYRSGDNDRFGYSNAADPGRNDYRGGMAQATIGLELNIPLYAGGLTGAQAREASQRLAQRESEHEDQRREVILQTRNLHRAVNTHVHQVQARQQSIRSRQASLKASQAGLSVGSRNTADVLNAERQLYQAIREYNDARYRYLIDSLKLKQAAGSLAVRDLIELSAHLEGDHDPTQAVQPPAPKALQPTTG